ncbi:hypothetical protein [Streptomyces sp. NBC_00046]|uniref:hypothetical protein n=1 Tax=unclassified Streptomyces TaxID=2593676 RepID=UPI0032461AC4
MLKRRPLLSTLLFLGFLLVVAMGWAGYRVWNGAPYPPTDPDRVAVRLKQEAQRVHDELAVPGQPEPANNRVETGTCYYRGLRYLAHFDRGRPDVRSFELGWRVPGVTREAARAGQERVRRRLEQAGWKLTSENVSGLGFRFEHPDSEYMIDVDWYGSSGILAVQVYAPCGKIPDGFDEYTWPESGWSPA